MATIALARSHLSEHYEHGLGVPHDPAMAAYWRQKSLEANPAPSGFALSNRSMTTTQIASGACESQANQCHSCANGRASTSPVIGSCFYDNVATCRAAILNFCKANPSTGQALRVTGGKLTNKQVYELTMSCPNIPHGSIPYSGTPPLPGSLKMQQC